MNAVCGIDLGTSGVKVTVVDRAGAVLAAATANYQVASQHPGWAETDPLAWWEAIGRAVRQVLAQAPAAEILAVGLDGQMHGLVLAAGDRPTRPAMLWPDSRAADQVARWRALPEALRARLSNPIVPGMAGVMLAWVAEHEPAALAQADRFLSPKDWVRQQLVGGPAVTDPSDASATLLWDPSAGTWHHGLLEALGLPSRLLPQVHPATAVAGTVTAAAAAAVGLPAGIPVSVGCGDAAATLLAAAPAAAETLVIVGTGIQVVQRDIAPHPDPQPRFHTFAAADGSYYAMVAPQNGGLALGRVVELLGADWAELYGALASPGRAGTDLVFAPWFSSERLPRPKAANRAGWQGLGLHNTRTHMLVAALEAVAFQVRQAVQSLPRATPRVRLAGGGTRDPLFQQLLTDALGVPTVRCDVEDSTAVGAALLGWAALASGKADSEAALAGGEAALAGRETAPAGRETAPAGGENERGGEVPASPVGVGVERYPAEVPGLLERYQRFLELAAAAEVAAEETAAAEEVAAPKPRG